MSIARMWPFFAGLAASSSINVAEWKDTPTWWISLTMVMAGLIGLAWPYIRRAEDRS